MSPLLTLEDMAACRRDENLRCDENLRYLRVENLIKIYAVVSKFM
jgi:hypothetical protein